MLKRFLIITAMIFLLAACNRDNVEVNPNDDGSMTISVRLSEREINTIVDTALASAPNPLLRNPHVEIQDGQIVISGQHDRRDGSGRVSGSVTLSITAQNGALQVQATTIEIEGFDASDERLQQFNQALLTRLNGRARRDNPRATFESVTIGGDLLTIQIRAERRN